MKFTLLALLLTTTSLWAIPEKDFPEVWVNKAVPHFQNLNHSEFTNAEGMKIHHYSLIKKENKKTLVIVPGRTEASMKYAELIYDLRNDGFNIFIIDHQGQGESTRVLSDTNKGHVRNFKNYIIDMEQWMKEVVLPQSKDMPLYLLAHSMGGAVAAKYMAKHPKQFVKAAFSAPMMEMNTKPYPEKIARLYSAFLVQIGKGTNYAPDRGPYIPEEDRFETNEHTHSEVRHTALKYIFVTWPNLAVEGPTVMWVNRALRATEKIDVDGKKIQTPILLLQAGGDLIVNPGRQVDFCKKAKCTLIQCPGSHHEILQEKDDIRDKALAEIRKFLI
ncbi:alpha/beta fold hydrolase [Peredibacter starrii]|uniref:Alpha/beta fold hydrolase n=1 Tax=Peredibacter starrii TaxID=28202 RepID=A0AAX4HJF5_9BACT|nr:alpha/beta fold hydrolase [Peredibacter starrii]WPU63346.1 alpha/beta fold hydrolase [Peredibacter starrii]